MHFIILTITQINPVIAVFNQKISNVKKKFNLKFLTKDHNELLGVRPCLRVRPKRNIIPWQVKIKARGKKTNWFFFCVTKNNVDDIQYVSLYDNSWKHTNCRVNHYIKVYTCTSLLFLIFRICNKINGSAKMLISKVSLLIPMFIKIYHFYVY